MRGALPCRADLAEAVVQTIRDIRQAQLRQSHPSEPGGGLGPSGIGLEPEIARGGQPLGEQPVRRQALGFGRQLEDAAGESSEAGG